MKKEEQMPEVSLCVKRASRFFQRARGLLLTKVFPKEYDGLFIVPCNSVHTLGMRYRIDVVFIDKSLRVVQINRSVRPWKPLVLCRGAYGVIELQEDSSASINRGQQIRLNYVKTDE